MERPKVLIIDDDENALTACRRVLESEGIDILLARNASEGLDLVVRVSPDLVLVDIRMRGMDGIEIARRIHNIDTTIVVIVITGHASVESAVAVIKEGVYDYLPKPFTPDELLIVVRRGLEKRRLDKETRALKEEKEAMERNFVTMVTHQLRSPLSAIIQYFEVLLSDIGGELTEIQREMLERAQERLNGLLELINDWLDMSRLQEAEIAARMRPVAIKDCVHAALAGLEYAGNDRGIEVVTEIADDLPMVRADFATLREVLRNLVANAINYNREGGRVWVRARATEHDVIIEVEDTGYGIDEKEIPFIFDQFYRGKAKEVRNKQGTGLGLAIAKKIIRAHGGKIEVTSRLGEGTTFRLHLNRADQ